MELLLHPWLTLEDYKNDTLSKFFSNNKTEMIGIKTVVLIAIDILHGICSLHGKKYSKTDRWCHGDIKPLNLYVNLHGIKEALQSSWNNN
jgi:serine/threonine protein kinase